MVSNVAEGGWLKLQYMKDRVDGVKMIGEFD